MDMIRVSCGGRTVKVISSAVHTRLSDWLLWMEVVNSKLLEFRSVSKNTSSFFFVFFGCLLCRGASEVIASKCGWIHGNRLLWLEIPACNFLEFLGFGNDLNTFVLIIVLLLGRRRTRKVVSCSCKAITLHRLFRVSVPSSDFIQLLGIGKNLFSLFTVLFVFGCRRAREVVASTGSGINSNGLLRMEVPLSGSLELLHLFQNAFAFIFQILIIILLWSGRSREIVSSTSSCVNRDRLLRMHVPLRHSQEFSSVCENLLALFGFFFNWCRWTSEVVASACSCIDCDRLLRVLIPLGHLFQL